MIENIISGLIGGIIVFILERIFNKIDKNKESKKAKIPKNTNSNTLLTNEIIESISPERNYQKVKEILGVPDKSFQDHSIFENETNDKEIFTSDLYFLKNAHLKVTTKDKTSISSITVFGYSKDIELPSIFYPCEKQSLKFGEAKICKEIIENSSKMMPVRTIRDLAFAVQTYSGAPFYKYATFFCFDDVTNLNNDYNKNEFLGKNIEGFCLSDSEASFYIYDYELR